MQFLGIFLKECKPGHSSDICTSILTATLFTIVKKWKLPKCPISDEWINNMRCLYTMEYYSAIKKN
jgi:hypothetical protein